MPKTTFERLIFTITGVLMMATTMATYNKYLVYREFSLYLFQQVAIAVAQKAPLAFLMQFFFVQKFASRQAAKYPTDKTIIYSCIRIGFTVMVMAPLMCAYSNIINAVQFHWSFGDFFAAFFSKVPVNWIFAFCVQVWLLTPLNKLLFRFIFRTQRTSVSA